MGTIGILALFVAFGAMAARYVTIVGFCVSSLAILAVLALLDLSVGLGLSLWTLGGCLVALEVGYAAGLLVSAVIGQTSHHASRRPVQDPPTLEGDLHAKPD